MIVLITIGILFIVGLIPNIAMVMMIFGSEMAKESLTDLTLAVS